MAAQSSTLPCGTRMRAKFPKVRTGCLTCKIRHKKCDEAKPTCRRCQIGNYKCDGYQQAKEPRSKQKPHVPAQVTSEQGLDLLYPYNLGQVPGSRQQKTHFHHVAHCTVQDLIGYSPALARFWCDYVLPFGHMVSPVRHALMSLGASHKSFLSRHHSGASNEDQQDCDHFAIQQYNKAISGLTQVMAKPSPLDVQAILTCCLIFVCIDNLNGRPSDALRHLRAGSDLLCSLQAAPTAYAARSAGTLQNSTELSTISEMFARLGLDASILVDDPVFRHQNTNSPPAVVTTDGILEPFPSSTAARAELHRLDLDFHKMMYPVDVNHGALESRYDCVPPGGVGACLGPARDSVLLQHLSNQFDRWTSRFNLYLEKISHQQVSDAEFKEAMVLSLHRKVWAVSMVAEMFPDAPIERWEFEEILDQAALVVSVGGSQARPVFSFDADTVPVVSFVAIFCNDRDLKRRAIAMLRSSNRREGVWDSSVMADIYEAEFKAEKPLPFSLKSLTDSPSPWNPELTPFSDDSPWVEVTTRDQ